MSILKVNIGSLQLVIYIPLDQTKMVVQKMSTDQLESYEGAEQFDCGTFLANTFVPIPRNHRNWTVYQGVAS